MNLLRSKVRSEGEELTPSTLAIIPMLDRGPKRSSDHWGAWNRLVLALLGLACLISPAINIGVDPYDLFRVSPIGIGPSLDQRYQHIRLLESNPKGFNVLMMGTSVMGINDPRLVDQLVPGARAYNMGFFVASPSDLLSAAKYLNSKGALPKHVIVGVDTFLFVARDAALRQQFRFPAEVDDESAMAWWLDAAFSSSLPQSMSKVVESFRSLPSVKFDLERGNYSLPRSAVAIRDDAAGHAALVFTPVAKIESDTHLVPSEFDALTKLVAFFERTGTSVLWIVEPNSSVLKNAYGQVRFKRLMDRIRERLSGDVVDLSEFGNLADDPALWYDMKHYTEKAGVDVLTTAIRKSATFSHLDLRIP